MDFVIKGRRMAMSYTPTPGDETYIKDLFDNVTFIKDALNRSGNPAVNGEFIASVPAAKGDKTMPASSLGIPRTETLKYNDRLNGLVNLDNENIFYLSTPNNLSITVPSEIHFTGLLTSFFPYEAYFNIYGLYLGDMGASLRTTNGNDEDSVFTGARFPLYKPFQCRMVYSEDKRVEIYIDGVKLAGSKKTYFTGLGSFFTALGFGTDTNNAKWFASSIMQINRLLTNKEATTTYMALKALYKTEVEIPYPIIKDISISSSGNIVSAVGSYYSPGGVEENTSLRKYRWYAAGNGSGAPDVTNNRLIPELNNLGTWNKSDHAALLATDTWFRVDIECTDNNNTTFGSASGCVYYKVN